LEAQKPRGKQIRVPDTPTLGNRQQFYGKPIARFTTCGSPLAETARRGAAETVEDLLRKQGLKFERFALRASSPSYAVPYHSKFTNRARCTVFEIGTADLEFHVGTTDDKPDFVLFRHIATLEGWNLVSKPPAGIADMLLSRKRGPSAHAPHDVTAVNLNPGEGCNFYDMHALNVPVAGLKKAMEALDRIGKLLLIHKEMAQGLATWEATELLKALPHITKQAKPS